jgi:hypothetical protein
LSKAGEIPMAEASDVIYAAVHSAFIKYPKEDDCGSAWDHQWIQPDESKHLTKVILIELAANGFEIVRKAV